MKILITTDCYKPMINGVVTSIVNLENELRKLGHEVKILCPSENHSCVQNGDIYRIGSLSFSKLTEGARLSFKLSKRNLQQLIEWKPDIIHSQTEFTSFIMARKIAEEAGCPIVHTYHTVYEDYTHYFSPSEHIGRKSAVTFSRKILRHTEAVIAPTQKTKDMLLGYGIANPIYIVPTGLVLDKFHTEVPQSDIAALKESLGIPRESHVLVTVGRVAKEKNIDELIRFFGKMNRRDTYLVIVGGGPYLNELKESAKSGNAADRIIFTGAVLPENIVKYYKMGDIFLSASQSETQGLTYIEALASGLPAVCRKDVCLDNVIENHVNGGQYTNFDEFQGYINELLSDDELRMQMSEEAVKTSEKYSANVFGKSIEKVYNDVLDERNRNETENTLYDRRYCS
jgi:1,2-diacylglycerol 3-alpha-glucosyltransferase